MKSEKPAYQFELLLFLINFINNIKLTYMFNFNNYKDESSHLTNPTRHMQISQSV